MPKSTRATAAAPTVRLNWRVATACTLGLTLLFTAQNYIAPPGRVSVSLAWVFVTQLLTWTLWLVLAPLVFSIGAAARARIRARGRVTAGIVVGQIVRSMGVAVLYGALNGLLRWALGLSASDDVTVVIPSFIGSTFAANILRFWFISAVYHAIAYHREVRERDADAARLAVSLAEARLETLAGRLHPHFLFNTLNAIAALIRDDPRTAEAMVANLSELLRAALNAESSREVTLERELDLLGRYVDIQRARFGDRLHATVHADPEVLSAYVPHLVLQPIVENAIRHGIAPREAPGSVWVRAMREGDTLRLIVQDDGVGVGNAPPSQMGSGIGIEGTRARLTHLYGPAARLHVADAAPSGTIVTIELPFHTQPRQRADVGDHESEETREEAVA